MRLLGLACFTLLCVPLLGVVTRQTTPAIHVFSCQVMSQPDIFPALVPKSDEIGLAVRFQNESAQNLSEIVFRTPYEASDVDFIDDGTFARGIRIDSYVLFEAGNSKTNWWGIVGDLAMLGLSRGGDAPFPTENVNVALPPYLSSEDPQNCTVVRTIASDGTLWENPAASQTPQILELPAPTLARKRGHPSPSPSPTPVSDPSRPVVLSSCSLLVYRGEFLTVHFTNQSNETLNELVVRAPYGSGALDFVDRGSFAPRVEITHHLRLKALDALHGRFLEQDATAEHCAVVRATFAGGTTWQNPVVAAEAAVPTPIPDQLVVRLLSVRWTSRHAYPTPIPRASPTATPG